ncbi:DMT family transporter [Companilactobacillus crustorum]|nr:multidrug efflux SMR transporter [Companilactobacillus crustorum]
MIQKVKFLTEEKPMNYLLLLVSIGFEVLGTSLLKKTDGFTNLWSTIGTLVSYFICLFVLSHVLKRLPLSLTYATWGSIGLILVTIAGIVFYHESISLASIAGLVLVISGTVLINVF